MIRKRCLEHKTLSHSALVVTLLVAVSCASAGPAICSVPALLVKTKRRRTKVNLEKGGGALYSVSMALEREREQEPKLLSVLDGVARGSEESAALRALRLQRWKDEAREQGLGLANCYRNVSGR